MTAARELASVPPPTLQTAEELAKALYDVADYAAVIGDPEMELLALQSVRALQRLIAKRDRGEAPKL